MATRWAGGRAAAILSASLLTILGHNLDTTAASSRTGAPETAQSSERSQVTGQRTQSNTVDTRAGAPDFERALRQQAETDRIWREASRGFMRMEKVVYRSRVGDLDIPAFVFQPLHAAAPGTLAAIVWVHENVRGHLYEHFIPYVRDAVARGYLVIAPEYRGSIGYGKPLYDGIDYGGAEVDDVVTAVSVLRTRYPGVDPAHIGIIGWSHGGLIALLAVFRNPTSFKAAAAIVPVTNLFQRFAWKGEEQLRADIDPQNRLGGLPAERRAIYRDRSPLFHIDALQIPLLVHVAENDEDVNIEETRPLVDGLRARKPALSDTKVYEHPLGGHIFDRRVDLKTLRPEDTADQVDSWNRLWRFFERQLAVQH